MAGGEKSKLLELQPRKYDEGHTEENIKSIGDVANDFVGKEDAANWIKNNISVYEKGDGDYNLVSTNSFGEIDIPDSERKPVSLRNQIRLLMTRESAEADLVVQ